MNVIITGASRGIGFELTQQFLNAGYTVFCLTRNLEPLKAIAHDNLKAISTDLSSQDSINEAVSIIKKEAPIQISNLQFVDSKGNASKIGRKLNAKSNLQRYSKKTGEFID